jgi:hypothetical protein
MKSAAEFLGTMWSQDFPPGEKPMKTLVEDEELKRLRAMAEGGRKFEESGLWERLSSLDMKEFMKLPARERLAVGYYLSAKRRLELLRT